MIFKWIAKKSTVSAFLFALCCAVGCSPQCNHWKLAVIKADCPSAYYSKIYLPSCNTFNGLEAIILSCNGNKHLYLNAYTLLLPFNPNDEAHTDTLFSIEEKDYSFTAERLQGGQCLLLPDEAMELVIDSLLENKSIEITVGRYFCTLIPDNFDKVYADIVP